MTTPTAPTIDKQAVQQVVKCGAGRVLNAQNDAACYQELKRLYETIGKYLHNNANIVK